MTKNDEYAVALLYFSRRYIRSHTIQIPQHNKVQSSTNQPNSLVTQAKNLAHHNVASYLDSAVCI
jgi:hypothetical protein